MLLASLSLFNGRVEILAVMVALVLSFICMGASIPLDKLADAAWTGDKCDDSIRSIMSAMGLLIGFDWEQCFDESVLMIAEQTERSGFILNEHSTRFLLTLFCACLLVPAWKMYILPYIVVNGWQYQFSQNGFKIEDVTGLAKTYMLADNVKRDENPEAWFWGDEPEDRLSEFHDQEGEGLSDKKTDALKRIQRVKNVLKATMELANKMEEELLNDPVEEEEFPTSEFSEEESEALS